MNRELLLLNLGNLVVLSEKTQTKAEENSKFILNISGQRFFCCPTEIRGR